MTLLKTLSGLEVPRLGLGTFPLQGRQMADVLITAARLGYKLIDTSDDYRGETGIGLGVSELYNKTGLKRDDIFLQTKISQDNSYGDEPLDGVWFNPNSIFQQRHTVKEVVRDKINISLREMKTEYLDSLLIHYPFPGYYEEVWEELIEVQKEGIVRYIGVSNFFPKHIEKLKYSNAIPAINELYLSPLCTRNAMLKYFKEYEIVPMCYSPLLGVKGKIAQDIINPLMEKYKKSFNQIILRWHVDRGCIPLAKTKSENRLYENFNIFDFKLEDSDIEILSALDVGQVVLAESKYCPGL